MKLDRPRVPTLDSDQWSEEVRDLLTGTISGRDGKPANIFATLAHHPKALKRWLVFGNHVLFKSTLPARERELVILRVGWLCDSAYEFGQHTVIGRRAGLTDDEIERVTGSPDAAEWSPEEAVLLRAADELVGDSFLTDPTWEALSKSWSTQQIIDLIFTVGQYQMVSSLLNTLGVQLDEGVPGFPPGSRDARDAG